LLEEEKLWGAWDALLGLAWNFPSETEAQLQLHFTFSSQHRHDSPSYAPIDCQCTQNTPHITNTASPAILSHVWRTTRRSTVPFKRWASPSSARPGSPSFDARYAKLRSYTRPYFWCFSVPMGVISQVLPAMEAGCPHSYSLIWESAMNGS
jgi:hypothetical protein